MTSCFEHEPPSPPAPLPHAGEGSYCWTAAKLGTGSFLSHCVAQAGGLQLAGRRPLVRWWVPSGW